MEASLRIFLLLVGVFIIAGIIWDMIRARRKDSERKAALSKSEIIENEFEEEVIVLQKPTKGITSASPSSTPNPSASSISSTMSSPTSSISSAPPTSSNSSMSRASLTTSSPTITTSAIKSPLIHRQTIEDDSFSNADSDSSNTTSYKSNSNKEDFNQRSHQTTQSATLSKPMILNVMARNLGVFTGRKLLEAFQEANLYFGEMQIFHHHEYPDGTGDIVFSVASAVEPGIFNPDKMDTFSTPGLTLFFMPSRPNLSIAAFESMLRTAKLLAQRLDGELRDEERKILGLQGIDRYRDRVRMLGYKYASI